MKNNNLKYWLPVVVVAILIVLFSTFLPAQGGFSKSNPSGLSGAYVVVNHSTGTTGVLLDSLNNATVVKDTPQTWIPTLTQSGSDTIVAVRYATYTRSGNYVNYELMVEIAPVKSGGIITGIINTFLFTPPIASNFTTAYQASGQVTVPPYSFSSVGLPLHGGHVYTDAGTDKVATLITYTNTNIGGGSTTFMLQWRGQYQIL